LGVLLIPFLRTNLCMCTVKKGYRFSRPLWDVTNQTLPSRETGKTRTFFLQCMEVLFKPCKIKMYSLHSFVHSRRCAVFSAQQLCPKTQNGKSLKTVIFNIAHSDLCLLISEHLQGQRQSPFLTGIIYSC
jgi:hypothetical protein